MTRYRIRPRATQDLIDHFAYIARDKIKPAERFLKVAEDLFTRLAEMPGMGRAWDSENPALAGIRVSPLPSPYRNYLVFYRTGEDRITEILAILHAARNIAAQLKDIL